MCVYSEMFHYVFIFFGVPGTLNSVVHYHHFLDYNCHLRYTAYGHTS